MLYVLDHVMNLVSIEKQLVAFLLEYTVSLELSLHFMFRHFCPIK